MPRSSASCRLTAPPDSAPTNHHNCRAERSEEHTSELQSHSVLVCRLLLEKKKAKACPLSLIALMINSLLCKTADLPDISISSLPNTHCFTKSNGRPGWMQLSNCQRTSAK